MGIMEKIQEGLNKGKQMVNKTMGGQQSAQGPASPQDAGAPVTDTAPTAGPDTATPTPSATTEPPVEPTSEV